MVVSHPEAPARDSCAESGNRGVRGVWHNGRVSACDLIEIPCQSLPPHAARVLEAIDRILVYRTPLTHRFRGITVRDGLILRGPAGWAEASPFWDYDAAESATWLRGAILDATYESAPLKRQRIPVNATIPVVDPQRAAELVRSSGGCSTVKVKVADPRSTLAQDCARVEAVRTALVENLPTGQRGNIRVDANTAWEREEAVAAIAQLDRAAGGLEYVEQPCASVEDLAWVRRKAEVPIAADESVRRASDPLAVARAEAADLLVVKVQPLGGSERVRRIVSETGLPVVVSSALDSSVGLANAACCAATLDELPYACGLGTARLLEGDVTRRRVLSENGSIAVSGPTIDEDEVRAVESETDADLVARWVRRLEQMAAHIDPAAKVEGAVK